jgi:hypothetical protein
MSGAGDPADRTAVTNEKTAVVAPMPMASVSAAASAVPGARRIWRNAVRRSSRMSSPPMLII